MAESRHIPRALSNEALRLLTELPMEEIERRLRREPAAVEGQPSDEELDELAWNWFSKTGSTWYQVSAFRAFARAVLARWGNEQPPRPIPVSERLPGPEDCDAEGRCWWYTPASAAMHAYWILRKPDPLWKWEPHWLPANALPLPLPEDQP